MIMANDTVSVRPATATQTPINTIPKCWMKLYGFPENHNDKEKKNKKKLQRKTNIVNWRHYTQIYHVFFKKKKKKWRGQSETEQRFTRKHQNVEFSISTECLWYARNMGNENLSSRLWGPCLQLFQSWAETISLTLIYTVIGYDLRKIREGMTLIVSQIVSLSSSSSRYAPFLCRQQLLDSHVM